MSWTHAEKSQVLPGNSLSSVFATTRRAVKNNNNLNTKGEVADAVVRVDVDRGTSIGGIWNHILKFAPTRIR